MGLFGRKREEKEQQENSEGLGLPDLPELDDIKQDYQSYVPKRTSSLPSFPGSMRNEGMSNQTVKNAVADSREFQPAFKSQEREIARSVEMDSRPSEFSQSERTNKQPIESFRPKIVPGIAKPYQSKDKKTGNTGPIFVRIDKFESALENIKMIKNKIEEMEKLLVSLRQVNAKEDFELSEWEKEITNIKSRIDSIDSNLFSKLD